MDINIKKVEEINKEVLEQILKELAEKRPIFHNEQDFQFELANMFRKLGDNIAVRLEYRNYVTENNEFFYFDETSLYGRDGMNNILENPASAKNINEW